VDIELIDLDDERSIAERVGGKAARLADARRRGLPALPGFTVLPGPGRMLVAEVYQEVSERGPHAVSLSLMERVPREVDLRLAVARARTLGPSLVARSSSVVEDDPVWSGAFSSFLDIQPEQLVTAVAGCWASTITRAVLEICERMGTEPYEVCPAVLVQSMVHPQAAGSATYLPAAPGERSDGIVEIVAVWGSPAPLMAGWAEGWRATVSGGVVTGPAVGEGTPGRGRGLDTPFPLVWFHAVADLASAALEGAPSVIEWAIADDRPVLLQARPAAGMVPKETASLDRLPSAGGPSGTSTGVREETAERVARIPGAVRAVRAIARFGGPLGDTLVLPWLIGLPQPQPQPQPQPVPAAMVSGCTGAELDIGATLAAANALVAEALHSCPGQAAGEAALLLAQVERGDLEVLSRIRPVDPGKADAVLRSLEAAGRKLVEVGALAHPEQLWSLSAAEVLRLLEHPVPGDWHRHRQRTLRWQALLQQVISVRGRGITGDGVSPGSAAGPARRLSSSRDLRRVVPGDVVVLHRPSPQLAPALWVASGLVAESGSGAAHLVEVARSLRVPAVVGVGLFEVTEGMDLLFVDGDSGKVAALPGDGASDADSGTEPVTASV